MAKGIMYIDGQRVPFDGETNVLSVIRKAGIEMPTFCYYSDLSVYGACRMCVVEDERGKIETSCSMKPRDGLSIRTNTARLLKHRRMILELLLASHNCSCTTCEKSGDCRLQELAMRFGVRRVRFGDSREESQLDDSSPAVVRDPSKCILCGDCVRVCGETIGMGIIDFAQRGYNMRVSPAFNRTLSETHCISCGQCSAVCPTGAIKYDMQDEVITEEVGCIVAATGYDLMDWTVYGEYGAGQYPDVITSLQYERIMSASGPTGGHIKRPSDGKEPKSVVFIQCVGSRDKSIGRPYCSGFCCMYTAKQAVLTKDHIPTSQSYVFYMDIRAPSKLYDEFTRRAIEEYGTEYIRGRVSKIYPDGNGQYIVKGVDTLLGQPVEIRADLVVLAVGIEASKGSPQLAEKLRISYDSYGFFMESHPKLKPVETNTAGVFLAGVCQGTKDIPSSVSQGSAAAAKVLALFARDKLENDPQIAQVDNKRCVACGKCIRCCPFGAITEVEFRGEKKAQVIETVCQGCGVCTSTCPQGAIQLSHATDNQILAEVNALCQC